MAIIFNGPIGIGTLLTVCLGGLILNFFMPVTKKVIERVSTNTFTSPIYDKDKNHYL
jgi:uncharacterized membrane protein YczE